MKITESQVKKLRITDVQNLDHLTVIVENFSKGSGKIIIECFGESWSHYWSHYWSHMGDGYTLETFFCQASNEYIAGKLCRGREDEPSWQGMQDILRKEIIKMRKNGDIEKHEARSFFNDASSIDHEVSAHFNSELLVSVLGYDWMFDIPYEPTREWRYLMKIIPVVKAAFAEISERAE